jgi:hypothetical protein
MEGQMDLGRMWRRGAIAAGLAVVVNLLLYGIGRAAGDTLVVAWGPEPVQMRIGAFAVITNTLLSFAVGLVVTALVVRRRPRRLRTMQIVAAGFTVVSVIQPLVVDTRLSTRMLLIAMHLITGAAFVAALQRSRTAETGVAPQPLETAGRHG